MYAANDDEIIAVKDILFEKLQKISDIRTCRGVILMDSLSNRTRRMQNDAVLGQFG